MRHFLAAAVTHLPSRMRLSSTAAALVATAGLTLPLTTTLTGARWTAVSSSNDIADRAQVHGATASRVSTDDDGKSDHGPAATPKRSTSARTCATQDGSNRDFTVQRGDRGPGGAISGSSLLGIEPFYIAVLQGATF